MRGDDDRHLEDGREETHEGTVLGLGTTHVDRVNLVAFGVHLVDNVARLQGDGFKSDVKFGGEIVERVIKDETGDHTLHTGIGEGRSITVLRCVSLAKKQREGIYLPSRDRNANPLSNELQNN